MQIPLTDVKSIEKSNSLYIVPNAIEISVDPSADSLFFASFLERDDCFNFIRRLLDIHQGLQRITSPEPIVHVNSSVEEARPESFDESTKRWEQELESMLPIPTNDFKAWKELEANIFDDPEVSRLLEANSERSARSLATGCWLDASFYRYK